MKGCANNVEDADWLSIKSLAEVKGVTHQAVSKRVAFFVRKGLMQTRRSGKEKLVHRPTFDTLAAASHDPAQDLRLRHVKGDERLSLCGESIETWSSAPDGDQGEPATPLGRPGQSAYDDASAREKNAKAAIAEMELARRRAELVPARELGDAAALVGTTIAQHIAALKGLSGKLYAAGATGGEEAVRLIITEEANRVLDNVKGALLKLTTEDASEPPVLPN